jgi:acetylornithine deacetylase/succinyl-diaminopimelate desuccinylase-like protein
MPDEKDRDLSRREFVRGTVSGLALAAAPAATQTDPGSKLIRTQLATYRKLGLDPQLWPRSAGSWPGYVFTDAPLKLPAGHFGLGHGTGAHAPDEYYLIESSNPKVQGLDGAIASFVEYLYALA